MIERLQQAFNSNPFYQHLGIKLVDIGEKKSRLEMYIQPFHLQLQNAVHGGAITAIADSAGVAALFGSYNDFRAFTTVELKINFLAPVAGGKLIAHGKAIHTGGRVGVAEVDIYSEKKRHIAKAIITCIAITEYKL